MTTFPYANGETPALPPGFKRPLEDARFPCRWDAGAELFAALSTQVGDLAGWMEGREMVMREVT